MIVEVFVAESNAEDTLSRHRLLVMNDEERVARVGDTAIYGIDKADTIVNFPQQHCAGVGCKAAAVKISLDFLFFRFEKSSGCVLQSVVVTAFLFKYNVQYNSLHYKQLGHLSIKKYEKPVKYSG